MYRSVFKRLFDFLAALLFIILTLPLIIIVASLLFVGNRGKVWFVQPRPGRNGEVFKLIKFRTMTDDRDAFGNLLPDGERLTVVGRFIRKTSLDELPQLINVLKGDMSLIGPRPLLVDYLPLYDPVQRRRHEVRPGITGWAQVNGRNAISWREKFEYDVWYVDHVSFVVDVKILFLTVAKVFRAEGIGSATSETMERFYGNN